MKPLLRLAACLLLVVASAAATTIVPISVETMAERAARVVLAEPLDSWTEWDNGQLYTYTRFRVLESYKGSPVSEVLVRQIGGTKDGLTVAVEGVRSFSPGRQNVLFLRPTKSGDAMSVVGLMQGRFDVVRARTGEMRVSNGVSHVRAYRSGRISEYQGSSMTLNELRNRVSKVVGQ